MTGDNRMILRGNDRRSVSPFGLWTDMDDLFDSFRRDIDSMFYDPLNMIPMKPRRVRMINRAYMPMNLKDGDENLDLTIEMPGVDKDDVRISIDEDILTVSVEQKEEEEEKEEGYLLRERSSYTCKRSIRIPTEVKGDDVSAEMKDGVLHVTLPKVEPQEKKVHDIKVN